MLILIRPYPLNHSGNHRCTLGGAGMGPRERAASSSITRARPAPTAGTTGIAAPWIAVSLMAGVRPEQARAIDWEQDVDLDGNPPSVAVPRGPIGERHEVALLAWALERCLH